MSAASQLKEAMKFEVEVIKGPHVGLRLSFNKQIVGIGRGAENDIILSSDPRCSRKHAEIRQRENDFVIVNLSEKNFILVNGQSVQTEILVSGSLIQIGDTEIRFNQDASQVRPPVPSESVPSVFSQPTPFKVAPSTSPVGVPRAQMPARPQPPVQPYGGIPHQSPFPHQAGGPAGRASSAGVFNNPKVRFYGIVALLGVVAWFLFFSDGSKVKKDPNAIRTSAISMQDVAAAEKRSQELLSVKKEKYDSVQYRRAQENFIKGFRDYQQGQYARAREAFQVVLNLDPENELANRYFRLSKIKFDEFVKFNMIQGNRYREKRNWRMCQSNYLNVMTMLQNRRDDPTYREAKQFYEECSLNLEGRF